MFLPLIFGVFGLSFGLALKTFFEEAKGTADHIQAASQPRKIASEPREKEL